MSDQLERESRSWWPSIRLSVRGMMLAVLILGGGLGWSVRRAHVQRDAVAAIKRGGGLVEFDWQYLNGKYLRNATPPGPRWLAAAIGPDFLGHPYRVVIGPGDAKSVMTQIGQFRRIRTLTLGRDPSISDADMVHLKGMADLEALFFDKGKITGAGLENFAGLPKLHTLSLQGIPLTDGDLRPLEALTNPDALTLDSPRITDVGLVHLKHLVPLRFISLNETGVTGAGLGNLADMSNLEILYLVKTNVSSLHSIQHLPNWYFANWSAAALK
ncbi:leucine-rich repeat domain-containing protein [Singulisphaera acidiphila]|uniref:Leucine Rich Repeat (LRR)-containing protein n=1 Tax=Singulisphaera acidiphila (strain ATCC BAA-1392 / DSM 18658 / VKM B-2454 / MOB10) TaxID=886293 RepID=L0DLG6_SINAD|nr:hypothetical protein [Singulisphaera acidiphila]AGA30234.1 hypothetical protein Sinac_6131 [Singulisphaera acidiphila DSM 18658]